MFTQKRLTAAYKRAQVQRFNQNSKYIIFSDLHRGDDSVSDEFTRNQPVLLHALNYYYRHGYTYIEAGDGDELWEYTDFKHIRLAHSDIFAALKRFYDKKRMIILYGNHNLQLKNKNYVKKNYFYYYDEYRQEYDKLFPDLNPIESLVLRNKKTKQEILIVHGHQGDLWNDQLWLISMLGLRYFWRYLHVVGLRNPTSPAKKLYKRHKIEKYYKRWIRQHNKVLICGHTHRPKFPKRHELPYFNSGCCIHTKGITGIEIINNSILMVNWRMSADKDGLLRMERTVVRGPEALAKYYRKPKRKPPNS